MAAAEKLAADNAAARKLATDKVPSEIINFTLKYQKRCLITP
jgi:hypothetical protein